MIKSTDTLTYEALKSLFNNEIMALLVNDYLHYPHINELCKTIKQQDTSSYAYEHNIVSHIGNSSYEIDNDKERSEYYYKNVDKNYAIQKEIFAPFPIPLEYIQKDINKIWEPGLELENLHGKKMFAGMIRIIHKGSAIHAHQDLVGWSNPDAIGIEDIMGQYGLNYFLQTPEEGGELLLWNKHLTQAEFYNKSKGNFCIPINELPKPDIKIKPRSGLLVILNARNLHAIETSIDNDRIAYSCFIAYRDFNKPLTYWT